MKKLIYLSIILILLITNAFTIQSQCSASVSTCGFSFSANGGSRTFEVSIPSNCGWGIENNYSWLSFSPQSYFTSSRVTVTCAPNNTFTRRSATLTINSGNKLTISIDQAAAPPAPIPNTAKNITANSFNANWGSVPYASYKIDVSTNSNFSSFVGSYQNYLVSNTNLTVSGLNSGTTYYYRVRAETADGTSANSSVISVTTTTNPPVVGNASNITTTSFRANWSAPSGVNGVTGYLLDIADNSNFSPCLPNCSNLPVNGLFKDVTGLNPIAIYYYRVRAVYASANSDYSAIQSLIIATPTAPLKIETSDITTNSFVVNWDAVPNASSYSIEVSTNSNFSTILNSSNVTSTSSSIQNLNPNTTYYYRIKSINSLGSSSYSRVIRVLTFYNISYSSGSEIINGTNRTLDKSNFIPGSIGGTIDVSPSGAATYSIPITVSPGSHGMQPDLSILYNSKSGNDILGYGWHLGGLSAITRVNKNQYYDGTNAAISFSSSDALALDGQRLISTGDNTYSPENDPYTKVQYNGTSFTVTTQDGVVMEYGNTDKSKFIINGKTVPITWAINKVTDFNGNYIEFIYEGDVNKGKYRLSEINYTGNNNAGLMPYNSVKFSYALRQDVNTLFIAGAESKQDLLLTSIKVFSENTLSKNYEFTYFNDGIYSKLNQISYSADGLEYNPTIINWGNTDYSSTVSDAGAELGSLYNNSVYFGDFNGDGRNDILKWNRKNSLSISFGQEGGSFSSPVNRAIPDGLSHLPSSTIDPNYLYENTYLSADVLDIQVVDKNNDGKDEIMVHYSEAHSQIAYHRPPNHQEIVSIQTFYKDEIESYSYNGSYFYATSEKHIDKESYQDKYDYFYADFDNNGTIDRLQKKNDKIFACDGITLSSIPDITANAIRFLDFEGDGITEFLALQSDGYGAIYKYNKIAKTFDCVYGNISTTMFAKPGNLFLGDFNGDGKADYLAYSNGGWTISYGTGLGYISNPLPLGLNLQNYEPSRTGTINEYDINDWSFDYYMRIINGVKYSLLTKKNPSIKLYYPASTLTINDTNKDGKSDVIYTLNGIVNIFISNGFSFKPSELSGNVSFVQNNEINNLNIVLIDLNSDGQEELIYGNDDNEPYFTTRTNIYGEEYNVIIVPGSSIHQNYKIISFTNKLIHNLQVNSITDGNNINTSISYDSPFTNASGTRNYPLVPIVKPINLAYNVRKKDLNTGDILSNMYYKYSNGLMHLQGKGFLGFATFSTVEGITGIYTSQNYNFTLPGTTGIYYTWLGSQSSTKGVFGEEIIPNQLEDIPLTTQTNSMSYYGGDITKKFFLPVQTVSETTDHLTGFTTTDAIVSFDATLGRITHQKTTTSDGWISESNCTYSSVSGNISRLTQVLNTSKLGFDAFTNTKVLSYSGSNPLQLSSEILQGLLTKNYTYDNFGNVIGESSATSDGTRSTSCVYDSKGRFVLSSTNQEGYTSFATYRGFDGAKLTETNYNNLTTTYDYKVQSGSYVTKTMLSDGNTSTLTLGWSQSGQGLHFSKNEVTNGCYVTCYFNAIGQKLSEVSSGYKGALLTTSYTYNPDQSTKTLLQPGYSTPVTYSYHRDGRLSSVTGPNNLNMSSVYSANTYTVKDNTSGETQTQTFDALGNVTKVEGTKGEVVYEYYASGNVKKVTALGDASHSTTMTYDLMGNQLSLADPDGGLTSYTYNGFGQILTQTDNKGQVSSCTYDTKGRLISQSGPGTSSTFSYYSIPGRLGKLQNITRDGVSRSFVYDDFGRPSIVTTSGAGKTFTTGFQYNIKGQLNSINYPTGLSVKYTYDDVGNITMISNSANNSMIWSGDIKNARDQWTNFSMGNGLKTVWTYDNNARLNAIQTGTNALPTNIQNLGFNYNNQDQLITRTDGSLSESFEYDGLDRLAKATVGSEVQQFNYLPNGNISNTSYAGNYKYLANQPHAVSEVAGVSALGQSPSVNTTSTYTSDNKIAVIDNGTYKDVFSYSPDGNRFKLDFFQGGVLQKTKLYIDNSEFLYDISGNLLCGRTLISAPTGICAVYQDTIINGVSTKEIFYIHTDYLGSWLAITDGTGTVKNRYSYDAWGRPRDPSTWLLKPITVTNALLNLNKMQPRFDRGYTGHELMAGFGLINMNGRLYDPYLQRFLSPDNEIQDPSNAQNYNRYSYCLNNPLRFTDPSGNWYLPPIDYTWMAYEFYYTRYVCDLALIAYGSDASLFSVSFELSPDGQTLYYSYSGMSRVYWDKEGNRRYNRQFNEEGRINFSPSFELSPLSSLVPQLVGFNPISTLNNDLSLPSIAEHTPDLLDFWSQSDGIDAIFSSTVAAYQTIDAVWILLQSFAAADASHLNGEGVVGYGKMDAFVEIVTISLPFMGEAKVAKSSASIGTKLEYVFGKATGSAHNIERSTGMLRQLESVGIFDNAAGRSLLNSHLESVYSGTKGILQSNGRYLRESLLMGPRGGLKVESIWEGNKLITVKLLGGL
jgi:RHS repeat-associated protein